MCSILIRFPGITVKNRKAACLGSKAALRKLKLYVRTALTGAGFQMSPAPGRQLKFLL
jgi:hypothetical protein